MFEDTIELGAVTIHPLVAIGNMTMHWNYHQQQLHVRVCQRGKKGPFVGPFVEEDKGVLALPHLHTRELRS